LLLLVIAAVVAYYCCRCGLFYYNVIRDKSRESEFSLEMPNVVNILNGLIEQHAKKRERERNMICDRQYQNIVHCENVDEIVTFGKGRPVVGRQQSYEMWKKGIKKEDSVVREVRSRTNKVSRDMSNSYIGWRHLLCFHWDLWRRRVFQMQIYFAAATEDSVILSILRHANPGTLNWLIVKDSSQLQWNMVKMNVGTARDAKRFASRPPN
jgi:hypothetical protein